MRMSALVLAGLCAGAAVFVPDSDNSSPAAAGLAGERGAARTFGSQERFGGPSSFSGAGLFFRSDSVEIRLGTRGLPRERRFGFDHRWDHGFWNRGFDHHRFTGPRIWDRRFGDYRLWRDRRFSDPGFRYHRFRSPRIWDRRFMEDPRFEFKSRPDFPRRDWGRRHFHGHTHGSFGNRGGRLGTRGR